MKKISVINSLNINIRKNFRLSAEHINNILYGFVGFMSFLSIIILAKLLEYMFTKDELINIDELDILLSVFGFIMIYIFKGFEHKSEK